MIILRGNDSYECHIHSQENTSFKVFARNAKHSWIVSIVKQWNQSYWHSHCVHISDVRIRRHSQISNAFARKSFPHSDYPPRYIDFVERSVCSTCLSLSMHEVVGILLEQRWPMTNLNIFFLSFCFLLSIKLRARISLTQYTNWGKKELWKPILFANNFRVFFFQKFLF